MRRYIDTQRLKELIDQNKTYEEISQIMGFNETSLCRHYTKHFGKKEDRASAYRQKIPITQEQKEIIFGSLLGDMCISKHVKNYRGAETHSIKQANYADSKRSLLIPLVGKPIVGQTVINNKTYNKRTFTLRPNLNLEEFYNSFYIGENNKKDVPHNLSLLTPRAIAFWFMDDGFVVTHGKHLLGFSTCSFSLEGLQRLQKYLQDTYNIETIIRKNFYLIVKAKDCKKLADMIKPYMIESMYYKLGKNLD